MAKEKILIVEDEKDLAQLMVKLMAQSDYETSVAYDGVTGLSLALQERPDLILLDLCLPKMDGMQILHRLREHQIIVPVVIVTAGRSEELAIEALRLGVRDYIKKPFALKALSEAVERALTEERLRRERATLTKQVLASNQELERRVGQLTALHEVGQALASTLELDELLDVILREASRVLEVNLTSIFLLDEESKELVFRSGTGEDARILVSLRLAPGQGIAGWVAEHGEPLLVRDAQSDPRYSPAFDELTGFVTESILCVPLMVKGHVIGVVEALNKPDAGFTDDDLAMLRLLAASAAVCIENAQLFEETRRLHRQTEVQLAQTTQAYSEIRTLQDTIEALISSLDLQEVLNRIVNSVVSGLGYNAAWLAEYDEQEHTLTVQATAAVSTLGTLTASYEEALGVRVLGSQVTMDQTENLAVRAALAGEIMVTSNLYDLIRPLVAQEVADTIQEAADLRAVASVPLLAKGHLVGNLFAASRNAELSDAELDSLQTLANEAAIAIENARLYENLRTSRDQTARHSEALEKRLSELSRLQQMAIELGKATIGADLRDVFEQLTEYAAALLEAESSAIMLFDQGRKELICQEPAFGVPTDIIRDWHVPLSQDSPVWAAWQSGGPLIVNDVADSPLVKEMGLEDVERRMGLRSTVFSVLRVGGRSIGVLQVSDKRDGSDFTSDDARVLEIFASQSAIAIENARILQRMAVLNRVGEAITARLTLPEVLEHVMRGIDELIEVEGVSIWLREPAGDGVGDQLSVVGSLPDRLGDLKLEPGEGIAGWVAQTGKPLIVHDAQSDPHYSRKIDQLRGFMTKSILCVPLQVRDEISGVIEVVNKIGEQFNQEDLKILSSVAASVAVAVENAHLFTGEKRRASEMEALVEIARAVTEAVTAHPKALLERIARGACEALGADCTIVYPFIATDPDTFDVANVATFGTLNPVDLSKNKVSAHQPSRVVRERKMLVCEDAACEQPSVLQAPFFQQEAIQSLAGILLEADEDELGVLYICFRAPHRFEERELTAVQLIAHQAALAIAKSRLFQTLNQDLLAANADLRRKVRELEELQTINNIISSTLEIDKVWDRILHGAMSITGAPYANILIMEEDSGSVISHMRRGDETSTKRFDPRDTVILPPITETGEGPSALGDLTEALDDETPWSLIYRQLIPDAQSVLYTPIVTGGDQERIGLLGIGSPRPREFDVDDRRLLEALANQAAIAIQNARYLEALRAYQDRQVEAERIAAMADVAGNMVHRINNTVGAIRPLIQQIEMKLERGQLNPDYVCEKLQAIRESADCTLDVARQIRRPFRDIKPEPTDVNESIAAAWAKLTAPVGIVVDFQYEANLSPVMATRQLDEVFCNLMRNSLDAMADEGGLLLVHSRQIGNRLVVVTIRDTGPGIPPSIRDKVFHMGTTTKRSGMGYGLWWSRMFLRRLGGDIVLESEEGQGCAFTVTLPITHKQDVTP